MILTRKYGLSTKCSEDIMLTVFLDLFPPTCCAILSVSDISDLTKLTFMADVFVQSSGGSQNNYVAAVYVPNAFLESLCKDIDKLTTEFHKFKLWSFQILQ